MSTAELLAPTRIGPDDNGMLMTPAPSGNVVADTLPEQESGVGKNRRRIDRAIWVGLARSPVPVSDVPAVAIEFVSRSKRDRLRNYVQKRKEYARAGVQQYWVIDRYRRRMVVYSGPKGEQVYEEQDTCRTDLLPGFELPLARLLHVADLYQD